MCGRYTLVRLAGLGELFPWIDDVPNAPPRYNIAPTQPVLVVANDAPDRYDFFSWGLVPFWAKDPSVGNKMINARGETLAARPAFREAYRRRRCLLPTDGFYEWRKSPDGKRKTPMYVRLRSREPFAFAGLWETWRPRRGSGAAEPEGELVSCAIVTTVAGEDMAPVHDRMPAVLAPGAWDGWLDPANDDLAGLAALLGPLPPGALELTPVGPRVVKF